MRRKKRKPYIYIKVLKVETGIEETIVVHEPQIEAAGALDSRENLEFNDAVARHPTSQLVARNRETPDGVL